MINTDEIYDLTDGGFQIFEHLLGSDLYKARKSLSAAKISFCIDGEKNASAGLVRTKNGLWILTVFNADAVPRTAINYWMHVRGVNFAQALREIVDELGLQLPSATVVMSQPTVTYRKAPAGTDPDYYKIDQMDGFTEKGLEVLGGMVVPETCHRYHFFQINAFTRREGDNLVTRTATPDYPMFALIFKNWAKIYQPLSHDKGGRFRYCGKKPDTFLFGMDVLEATYEKLNEREPAPAGENDQEEKKSKGPEKVEYVFIMSGDRDAMNMAGAGFNVVWRNSESEPISGAVYSNLRKYASTIINVPDIDDEGIRYANALADKYLDLLTLWLPDAIKERSYRGKPGKDFRDWIGMQDLKVSKYTPDADKEAEKNRKRGAVIRDIRDMVKTAYPMQFWNESYNRRSGGLTYNLSPTYAFNFLRSKGYGLIKSPNAKGGYQVVYVKDGVVREAEVPEMRQVINAFAEQRRLPVALRDAIMKTTLISDATTFNMKEFALDFTKAGMSHQWMFFQNAAWKITPEKIEQYRRIPDGICAWEDTISPHRVKLREDAPFRIEWDMAAKRYDIKIFDKASNYFKILINCSRVHWKTEWDSFGDDARMRDQYFADNRFEIAGSRLSDEQAAEQKQHLINKIFAIGYLLHSYKDLARTWAVFAMDNRLGNGRDSNGGSGKSFVFNFLEHFTKWYYQEGRDSRLTEREHLFQGVTEYTDLIMIDDANRYLKFDYFFSKITGGMSINPKNLPPYTIPFKKSPKFIFTSNYIIPEDPSTSRRLLYTVFSDWYHAKMDGDEYQGEHKIMDDFGGRTLFDEKYAEVEWNEDINFLAFCLRFYMQTTTEECAGVPEMQKINPPMSNVKLRQILTQIDMNFMEWADTFICDRLGEKIPRTEMWENFLSNGGARRDQWTAHRFKKNLDAWVKFRGYVLNPDSNAKDGRILEKLPNSKVSVEFFVIAENKDTKISDMKI